MALDPVRGLPQVGRTEAALSGPPHLLRDDEVGDLQDRDVLFDPVDRQPERACKLGDGGRTPFQLLQDPAPGGVGQGEERLVEGRR